MCVNAHVACRPSQTLVLPIGDVFFGLGVYVFFGQTKVNDVDGVLPLASWPPNKKVFRLHVSVDQTLGVDILHPCYLGERSVLAFEVLIALQAEQFPNMKTQSSLCKTR